jgi:hypothetical protein
LFGSCRSTRAACVRRIGRPHTSDSQGLGNLPRAFQAMCRNHAALIKNDSQRAPDEEDYERGCSRLVGCISTSTFEVLMLMSKEPRCAFTVAASVLQPISNIVGMLRDDYAVHLVHHVALAASPSWQIGNTHTHTRSNVPVSW